jgi:hypothetical protein
MGKGKGEFKFFVKNLQKMLFTGSNIALDKIKKIVLNL